MWDRETVRVEFPDGAWVEVKSEMSQADHDYVVNAMLRGRVTMRGGDKAEDAEQEVKLDMGKTPLLQRMITGWSWPDPVTPERVAAMPRRYSALILERLDKLQTAAEAWGKNSEAASI